MLWLKAIIKNIKYRSLIHLGCTCSLYCVRYIDQPWYSQDYITISDEFILGTSTIDWVRGDWIKNQCHAIMEFAGKFSWLWRPSHIMTCAHFYTYHWVTSVMIAQQNVYWIYKGYRIICNLVHVRLGTAFIRKFYNRSTIITVTSHKPHGVANRRQLYYLVNSLFRLTQKKNKISALLALRVDNPLVLIF